MTQEKWYIYIHTQKKHHNNSKINFEVENVMNSNYVKFKK